MAEEVKILVLGSDDLKLPIYASKEAAGADVYAHLKEPLIINAGESSLIPTGLVLQIPPGYEIQVRPRSGLALKSQITVLNTPGTIDSDYRGEVGIILMNHGKKPFTVENGMRIAQLVVARALQAEYLFAYELAASARGSGGFGHTGEH